MPQIARQRRVQRGSAAGNFANAFGQIGQALVGRDQYQLEQEKQNLLEQVKIYNDAMKTMKDMGLEGSPQYLDIARKKLALLVPGFDENTQLPVKGVDIPPSGRTASLQLGQANQRAFQKSKARSQGTVAGKRPPDRPAVGGGPIPGVPMALGNFSQSALAQQERTGRLTAAGRRIGAERVRLLALRQASELSEARARGTARARAPKPQKRDTYLTKLQSKRLDKIDDITSKIKVMRKSLGLGSGEAPQPDFGRFAGGKVKNQSELDRWSELQDELALQQGYLGKIQQYAAQKGAILGLDPRTDSPTTQARGNSKENPARIESAADYNALAKGDWYIDPGTGKPQQKKF